MFLWTLPLHITKISRYACFTSIKGCLFRRPNIFIKETGVTFSSSSKRICRKLARKLCVQIFGWHVQQLILGKRTPRMWMLLQSQGIVDGVVVSAYFIMCCIFLEFRIEKLNLHFWMHTCQKPIWTPLKVNNLFQYLEGQTNKAKPSY